MKCRKHLSLLAAAFLASSGAYEQTHAGAYLFAGEGDAINSVTHPTGYSPLTGGVVTVRVCQQEAGVIDPAVAETLALAEWEQPVRNIIATYNRLEPTVGNLRSSALPSSSTYDFESVALHELGHCIGKAHVNAASGSGLTGADQNYTTATNGGPPNNFDIDDGADNIIGTADDLRGDDVNLHWFRKANNNPFTIEYDATTFAPLVDSSTYARDTADLPSGDNFAANADRNVGKSALDAKNTEAVMQQGTFNAEIQRTLSADDVATIQYAMAGVNEIAGDSDDYTVQLQLSTPAEGCDVNISFDDSQTGFAVCQVGATQVGPNHWAITTGDIYFNSGYLWYFNNSAPCSQEISLTQDEWHMVSMPCLTGISTGATVEDVLADDLGTNYGTDWEIWARDSADSSYNMLGYTEELENGRGYWIKTQLSGQSFTVVGEYPASPDILLRGEEGVGRFNLIGHPLDSVVNWNDVQVLDGATIKHTSELNNTTEMSRQFWVYDSSLPSNYKTFDVLTPGMEPQSTDLDLNIGAGFWVKVYKDGLRLRIPSEDSTAVAEEQPLLMEASAAAMPLAQSESAGEAALLARNAETTTTAQDFLPGGGWYVRITAESGGRTTRGSVLGQLADSEDGQDSHDLEMLEPFADSYFAVQFPHPEWEGSEWGFASDYRNLTEKPSGKWDFAVYASSDIEEITLHFDGPAEILKKSKLRHKSANGRKITKRGKSYTFKPEPGFNYFTFLVKKT